LQGDITGRKVRKRGSIHGRGGTFRPAILMKGKGGGGGGRVTSKIKDGILNLAKPKKWRGPRTGGKIKAANDARVRKNVTYLKGRGSRAIGDEKSTHAMDKKASKGRPSIAGGRKRDKKGGVRTSFFRTVRWRPGSVPGVKTLASGKRETDKDEEGG